MQKKNSILERTANLFFQQQHESEFLTADYKRSTRQRNAFYKLPFRPQRYNASLLRRNGKRPLEAGRHSLDSVILLFKSPTWSFNMPLLSFFMLRQRTCWQNESSSPQSLENSTSTGLKRRCKYIEKSRVGIPNAHLKDSNKLDL